MPSATAADESSVPPVRKRQRMTPVAALSAYTDPSPTPTYSESCPRCASTGGGGVPVGVGAGPVNRMGVAPPSHPVSPASAHTSSETPTHLPTLDRRPTLMLLCTWNLPLESPVGISRSRCRCADPLRAWATGSLAPAHEAVERVKGLP